VSPLAAVKGLGENVGVQIRVECYAGGKADERPVRFCLGDRTLRVGEILDQWYGPEDTFFKVLADDGNLYILRRNYSESEAVWTLESFRRLTPAKPTMA
jgi:hypothetical protein